VTPADQGSVIYNYQAEVFRVETGIRVVWNAGGTAAVPVIPNSVEYTGLLATQVGLVRQRQYKFRIAAENELGLGEWSEWASLTSPPRGFCLNPPNTPLNFGRHTDTPVTGKIKLQWNAIDNENAAGGDDIAAITYEVWAGAVEETLRGETSNNYFELNVPAGQTWKVKVRSKNSSGQSSIFTAILNMISALLPAIPPTLALSSTTANQVVMTWTVPANGGSPITGYEVSNDGFNAIIIPVPNTDVTATVGGAGGQLTTFSVRAVNAVGTGPAQSQQITVMAR